MGNTFGKLFSITTFGESHGGGVGVVIDGCPPGHKISLAKVQQWLERRKPGQSVITTSRKEPDQVECLSGLQDGITLGTPITLMVRNKDMKSGDYGDIGQIYRPSHSDYTTDAKFGVQAASGGGRSSARETIGRVAAAAVAEQILEELIPKFKVVAYVESVKDIHADIKDPEKIKRDEVESNMVRCPDAKTAKAMEKFIMDVRKKGDTVGGVVFCGISGCPVGLGEPVFDKLEADLAKAMMSLPASKGFEIGLGWQSTQLFGSEHNDAFYMEKKKVRTKTNNSGGVQGGISNGEFIYMRTAFKPVSTIFKVQNTVTRAGKEVKFKPKAGRHDPCVLPRAVPMVEAMAVLVIMDHYLRQRALTAK